MKNLPPILDPCCGSKMFYFDKHDPRVCFSDCRTLELELCSNGTMLEIKPDIISDFRNMPFPDNSFQCVIFDPPHLRCGETSYMYKKYGTLRADWKINLSQGFAECFRVLKTNGILIFKWSDSFKPLYEILKLTSQKPVIRHTKNTTHFVVFIKTCKTAE